MCHKRGGVDRLGEISVGAGSETLDDVFVVGETRQHLDRCEIAGRAKPLGHLEPPDVRKVHIQQDDVVPAFPRHRQSLSTGGRMITFGAACP